MTYREIQEEATSIHDWITAPNSPYKIEHKHGLMKRTSYFKAFRAEAAQRKHDQATIKKLAAEIDTEVSFDA